MAKLTKTVKSTGAGKKSGAGKKASARKKSASADSPQRRKDPVFMKNLESAIAGEFAKSSGTDGTPKASMASMAARTAPPKPLQGSARPSRAAGDAQAAEAAQPSRAAAVASVRGAKKRPSPAGNKALAAELASLIPQLDDEGLAFLIEQARVHLYNMRVTELESAAEEAERASTRAANLRSTGKAAVGAAKPSKAGASAGSDFSIKAASDGSAYDLVWQGKWKMFTGDEMLAMVRIALNKDPAAEVGARLYRWFVAERKDVLQDIPFAGMADPKLKSLVMLLRNTFKVKGGK